MPSSDKAWGGGIDKLPFEIDIICFPLIWSCLKSPLYWADIGQAFPDTFVILNQLPEQCIRHLVGPPGGGDHPKHQDGQQPNRIPFHPIPPILASGVGKHPRG
jgi:hypothetical protein